LHNTKQFDKPTEWMDVGEVGATELSTGQYFRPTPNLNQKMLTLALIWF